MRGLPNYPHGIIFTFWEQYVSLRFYLTMAVVAALAAVFVTLAIILLNIVAAFLVVLWLVSFCDFLDEYLCFDTGHSGKDSGVVDMLMLLHQLQTCVMHVSYVMTRAV